MLLTVEACLGRSWGRLHSPLPAEGEVGAHLQGWEDQECGSPLVHSTFLHYHCSVIGDMGTPQC